ncbi:hypothetical protein HY968_01260 [Candidatus Kaiserbacteria bacterium]|nr:hypothetical protein [Candidatus Kaiserbacteria bacterium]
MRAWIAVAAFSLAGVLDLYFLAPSSQVVAPQAIFYALLVGNTYFSIRFFAPLIVISWKQITVDCVLVVLYIVLALSLGYSLLFPLVATMLFLLATVKYAIELSGSLHADVFGRKMRIDMLAAALCAASFFMAFAYPQVSAWTLTGIFSAANVYLLFMSPMYKL